jgi:hypothetical protein
VCHLRSRLASRTQAFWLPVWTSGPGGSRLGAGVGNQNGDSGSLPFTPAEAQVLQPLACSPRPCQLPWIEWRVRTSTSAQTARTEPERNSQRRQRWPRCLQSSCWKVVTSAGLAAPAASGLCVPVAGQGGGFGCPLFCFSLTEW